MYTLSVVPFKFVPIFHCNWPKLVYNKCHQLTYIREYTSDLIWSRLVPDQARTLNSPVSSQCLVLQCIGNTALKGPSPNMAILRSSSHHRQINFSVCLYVYIYACTYSCKVTLTVWRSTMQCTMQKRCQIYGHADPPPLKKWFYSQYTTLLHWYTDCVRLG